MRFRVTDERAWERRFEAADAAGLATGIRIACTEHMEGDAARSVRLHVWGATNSPAGLWLTPTSNPIAPCVTAFIGTVDCERLFSAAARMVQHHGNLMNLADDVGETVRTIQFPAPKAVN